MNNIEKIRYFFSKKHSWEIKSELEKEFGIRISVSILIKFLKNIVYLYFSILKNKELIEKRKKIIEQRDKYKKLENTRLLQVS